MLSVHELWLDQRVLVGRGRVTGFKVSEFQGFNNWDGTVARPNFFMNIVCP